MLSQQNKQAIIEQVLDDVHDIYVDLPKDFCFYIIGQTIEKTEKALSYDTGKIINDKIKELKLKWKPIQSESEKSDFPQEIPVFPMEIDDEPIIDEPAKKERIKKI